MPQAHCMPEHNNILPWFNKTRTTKTTTTTTTTTTFLCRHGVNPRQSKPKSEPTQANPS